MNTKIWMVAGLVGAVAAGIVFWQTLAPVADAPAHALVEVVLPAALSETETMGKRAFEARCAACHGANAAGIDGAGPPLVHQLYVAGHHGDEAFLRAARDGARAHHWPFGDMPPVEGISEAEVLTIVAYVRALQAANGI